MYMYTLHVYVYFSTFFTGKVDTIRATTASAPAPTIEHRQVPQLASFNNVTVEEVSQILRKTPNKQCELDPMPTWLVKELCDVLAPIITSMAYASFTQGLFPDSHKHAVVRPRIKNPSTHLTLSHADQSLTLAWSPKQLSSWS